jgi:hypothetical protein
MRLGQSIDRGSEYELLGIEIFIWGKPWELQNILLDRLVRKVRGSDISYVRGFLIRFPTA